MKSVLITGGSGVIGRALVPRFLQDRDAEVCLLLRSESAGQLRMRLETLRDYWSAECSGDEFRRLHVYAGDVCRPRLGLEESVGLKLANTVTHIVHGAGNVRLNQSLEEARSNIVGAMRHVTHFARMCPRLEKLNVVSTVGVAGREPGGLAEAPLTVPQSFRNAYEAAKAEAESVLWAEVGAGLPATIHRPSMIVGDSRTGRIGSFQVFYHLIELLSGRKTFGLVPDTTGARLDIIPVDYVAAAIHDATCRPATIGQVLHLCSGPEGSILLRALSDRLLQLNASAGLPAGRVRYVPRVWFNGFTRIAGQVSWGRTRRVFRSLPYLLEYLGEEQWFENRQTRAVFGHRLSIPKVEDYLPIVLAYYWRAEQARAA